MTNAGYIRRYDPMASVVFQKTRERFGGLSNMAPGFPLTVNEIRILNSEALYQACRFPHRPEVQRRIIDERSPMTAKMHSKRYREQSRVDWDAVRVRIMRWCLRIKLAQNWREFSRLLLETEDLPIVERSRRDAFWGAKATEHGTLVGINALGRLLMELREQLKTQTWLKLRVVEPLSIPNFLLFRDPIVTVRVGKGIDSPGELDLFQTPLMERPIITEPFSTSAFDGKGIDSISKDVPKRYPSYRDSGKPWLGRVPAHWDVRRVKYLLRECDIRSTDGSEELLRVSQYTGVTLRSPTNNGNEPDTRAASLAGYKRVEPNDLVVNIMLAWNGSLGVSQFHGISSPAYCVYRFRENSHPWYFHHLLRSPTYKARIKSNSTGVVESRLRLYTDDLYRLEAPVPPLPEQIAIVHFLDHADRRIRRYIRAKQKLIALLEEQRQAIIHQAVTGQIDVRTDQPYPAYKASGVKLLGRVPGHWEVQQLGRFGQFFKGAGGTKDDEVEHGVPCVRYGDLYTTHEFFVTNSRAYVTEERAADYAPIRYGDVLFAGSGETIDEIGKSAVNLLSTHACCGGDIIVFRPCIGCNAKFLGYAADSWAASNQKSTMGRGITVMHIYGTSLKYVRVVLPPVPEQTSIVGFLDRIAEEVKRATAQTQSEIDLLREYRTRLIADVVTGKFDVREAAAELPEDVVQDDTDESEAERTSEHPVM